MRVTKLRDIPEKEIDELFFPFYELDSEWDGIDSCRAGVRETLRKSIFNDFGYDVYGIFSDNSEENFLKVDEIFENRVIDYTNLVIQKLTQTVNGDIERQSALKEFSQSKAYDDICRAEESVLGRCQLFIQVFGGDKKKALMWDDETADFSSGHSEAISEQVNKIPQKLRNDQRNFKFSSGEKSKQDVDINKRMTLVAKFTNELKEREGVEKIKGSLRPSTSKQIREKLEKAEYSIIPNQEGELNPKEGEKGSEPSSVMSGGMSKGDDGDSEMVISYRDIAEIIKKIDWSKYAVINIGNKDSIFSSFKSEEEIRSSKIPSEHSIIRRISRSDQIGRLRPVEMAIEDDLFYLRFFSKQSLVRDYIVPKKVSQAFFILLDVSGSMTGIKEDFSKSVLSVLLDRVVSSGSAYFLQRFAGNPYFPIISATTEEESSKVKMSIDSIVCNGGGTNIRAALLSAVEILTDKAKREFYFHSEMPKSFEKMDILLITDGLDSFSFVKEELKDVKLHSFIFESNKKNAVKLRRRIGWEKSKYEENSSYYSDGVNVLARISDNTEVLNPSEEYAKASSLLESAIDSNLGVYSY